MYDLHVPVERYEAERSKMNDIINNLDENKELVIAIFIIFRLTASPRPFPCIEITWIVMDVLQFRTRQVRRKKKGKDV
jgi:hypothetical protein